MTIDISQIEIYYDGMNIHKYGLNPIVKGFTTNCSLFSKHSNTNYISYFNDIKSILNDRPLSFQIWEDNTGDTIKQIDNIHSINNNIFIKIPVLNSEGSLNNEVIKYALEKGCSVNITCIFTFEQISSVYEIVKNYTNPMIISVFAASISDTGVEPTQFISNAVNTFKEMKNCKILWAGCREVYTINSAIKANCHIITVPDTIIDKLQLLNKNLTEYSIERIKIFKQDAQNGGLTITS
jgi:transaldolase